MTVDRVTLSKLVARCEQATKSNGQLSFEIWEAVGRPGEMAPRYTGSLDAAMTLLPTDGSIKLIDLTLSWEPDDATVWPACSMRWYPPEKIGNDWHARVVTAATPALAVCAAALSARADRILP